MTTNYISSLSTQLPGLLTGDFMLPLMVDVKVPALCIGGGFVLLLIFLLVSRRGATAMYVAVAMLVLLGGGCALALMSPSEGWHKTHDAFMADTLKFMNITKTPADLTRLDVIRLHKEMELDQIASQELAVRMKNMPGMTPEKLAMAESQFMYNYHHRKELLEKAAMLVKKAKEEQAKHAGDAPNIVPDASRPSPASQAQ